MSTHAKLFLAAVGLLGLGLALGLWPLHATTAFDSANCGTAFASNAEDYYGMGRDLCEGKVAMMRYPALILLGLGVVTAMLAMHLRSEATGSYKSQRTPR